MLPAVQDRGDPDRVGMHAIDQAIRRLAELTDLGAIHIRHNTPRLREQTRLSSA